MDEEGKIRNRFWIKEQKRGKRHEIAINQSMKEALVEYLEADCVRCPLCGQVMHKQKIIPAYERKPPWITRSLSCLL